MTEKLLNLLLMSALISLIEPKKKMFLSLNRQRNTSFARCCRRISRTSNGREKQGGQQEEDATRWMT